jgi:hypothetical protein
VEQECEDNARENKNPHQQEHKYPIAELLTAHPFDAEIKLGR